MGRLKAGVKAHGPSGSFSLMGGGDAARPPLLSRSSQGLWDRVSHAHGPPEAWLRAWGEFGRGEEGGEFLVLEGPKF